MFRKNSIIEQLFTILMKTTAKTATSLVLMLIFVIACSFAIILFFAAGWLHTYKVFTKETPIASVKVSELKTDEQGREYFNVEIQQVKGRSPLASIFNPYDKSDDQLESPDSFILYGDELHVGGPTIKFKDFLTLLNFDLVYKMAFVKAEYTNIEFEDARTSDMPGRYDLNGGYSTWRTVYEDVQNNTFRGQILKLFIDNLPQISTQGIFVTNQEQSLVLCVTEENFYFCNKEL